MNNSLLGTSGDMLKDLLESKGIKSYFFYFDLTNQIS